MDQVEDGNPKTKAPPRRGCCKRWGSFQPRTVNWEEERTCVSVNGWDTMECSSQATQWAERCVPMGGSRGWDVWVREARQSPPLPRGTEASIYRKLNHGLSCPAAHLTLLSLSLYTGAVQFTPAYPTPCCKHNPQAHKESQFQWKLTDRKIQVFEES